MQSACSSIRVRGWYLPGRIAPTGSVAIASLRGALSLAAKQRVESAAQTLGLVRFIRLVMPAFQNLLGKRDIGLRALATPCPRPRPARRSSAPPRGARCAAPACGRPCRRNAAQLLRYLVGKRVARIEHGTQQPGDFEARIQVRAHPLDRADQVREPLQRVVLALHRDQHLLGGAQTRSPSAG